MLSVTHSGSQGAGLPGWSGLWESEKSEMPPCACHDLDPPAKQTPDRREPPSRNSLCTVSILVFKHACTGIRWLSLSSSAYARVRHSVQSWNARHLVSLLCLCCCVSVAVAGCPSARPASPPSPPCLPLSPWGQVLVEKRTQQALHNGSRHVGLPPAGTDPPCPGQPGRCHTLSAQVFVESHFRNAPPHRGSDSWVCANHSPA